jgi:hypothetical protein
VFPTIVTTDEAVETEAVRPFVPAVVDVAEPAAAPSCAPVEVIATVEVPAVAPAITPTTI